VVERVDNETDSSDDSGDDDNDCDGRFVAKAKKMRKEVEGADNEAATATTAAVTTAMAAATTAAATTTTPALLSCEAVAAEFVRKGFKLENGVLLNSKDKKDKVLPFVLKILRDNPNLDEYQSTTMYLRARLRIG
jgi:hypothetical protein